MSRFRLEVNGKEFNVTYGQASDADAKARDLFTRKGIRQVRVYDTTDGACVLHLGTATVVKTSHKLGTNYVSPGLRDGQKVYAGWSFMENGSRSYAFGKYQKAWTLSSTGQRFAASVLVDLDNGKGRRAYEGCQEIYSLADAKAMLGVYPMPTTRF